MSSTSSRTASSNSGVMKTRSTAVAILKVACNGVTFGRGVILVKLKKRKRGVQEEAWVGGCGAKVHASGIRKVQRLGGM